MEIRLYDTVSKMPGGDEYRLSDVFITPESEHIKRKELELSCLLSALLDVPADITAHVSIEVDGALGTDVAIILTSRPNRNNRFSVFWGIGYDMDPEGGEYVERLNIDPQESKIGSDRYEKHAALVKSEAQWKEYFVSLLMGMYKSAQKELKRLAPLAVLS